MPRTSIRSLSRSHFSSHSKCVLNKMAVDLVFLAAAVPVPLKAIVITRRCVFARVSHFSFRQLFIVVVQLPSEPKRFLYRVALGCLSRRSFRLLRSIQPGWKFSTLVEGELPKKVHLSFASLRSFESTQLLCMEVGSPFFASNRLL